MQRWSGGEKARVSHCRGLPDLEVKVAARLSIMCDGYPGSVFPPKSNMGLGCRWSGDPCMGVRT